MKLICPGFTGGLTVIPPLETCELFWANFAFTTLFRSWNMVLQPKYKLYQYDICPLQKKTQQRTNNRTFYKYKKSERDFLVTAISKIPYRLRNAACRPLHVLLQTFPCSYTPCIFLTDITKRRDKNTKICQLISLVFDTIYKRRNPTTTTWPVTSKLSRKQTVKLTALFTNMRTLNFKSLLRNCVFAAVNHNYDQKQRTLKHRNTQNGSKSTNHKSQSMTFWTR